MGAQADMRRRSDLLSSFLTETHESFQENNAERTIVREHCCLELNTTRHRLCRAEAGVRANASTEKLFRVFRAEHCNRRETAARKLRVVPLRRRAFFRF